MKEMINKINLAANLETVEMIFDNHEQLENISHAIYYYF